MFVKLKNSRYMQYVSAITATLSMTAGAMHILWTSPTMGILQSDESPVGRPISDEEGSWVVGLHKLGVLPATIIAGWLVEAIGRKYTLLIAGLTLLTPWFMIIFGNNITILYIARFVSGAGLGTLIICCSIYNGEISENDIRGKLGTTLIALKFIGSILVLCVGPYISYRALGILSAAIPVVFLCTFVFMPESPYYLMKTNKREKAEKNLRLLSSNLVDDKFITSRLDDIEICVQKDMENKTTIWEFMTNKEYRKAIIIIAGVKTLQSFSGEGAIDAYMQSIIELTGSSISPEASSIIFGSVQLPAVLISTFLVDRIGRKPLLLISSFGCGIALFCEGLYFYLQDAAEADVSSISWLPTTGIALYVIMNPIGIVTLPYVLLGELFPTNIKGIAVSAATFYGAATAFVVAKYFKPVSNALGVYTSFWIFSGTCVLGGIFLIIFLPETKGKSFIEIQDLLNRKKSTVDIDWKKNEDLETK